MKASMVQGHSLVRPGIRPGGIRPGPTRYTKKPRKAENQKEKTRCRPAKTRNFPAILVWIAWARRKPTSFFYSKTS